MRSLNVALCLAALVATPGLSIAQQDDVDPAGAGQVGATTLGGPRAMGDVVRGPFDVETTPFDNRCLGVEHAWGHFWVTGRGHTTIGDNWMVHKYDMTGVYLSSYPQNLSLGYAGWGGRDLASDEAGNKLWSGTDGGELGEYDYDPISGGLTAGAVTFTAVPATIRALARNPATGNFFTKDFSGDIFEFDSIGVLVTQNVNANSVYGMGWYGPGSTILMCGGIGAVEGIEVDPVTGVDTGRTFSTSLGGSPGGCDVYDDPLNPNTTSVVMLHQTAPDSIVSYDATGMPPPPPPTWPNLPTTFVAADGYSDGFETHAGVVPSHMAVNALNDSTGLPGVEAWCNIGQMGPIGQGSSLGPRTGLYNLEMGVDPLLGSGPTSREGLIIGLDGTGTSNLLLDFWAIDYGEETHTWDGVWVSDDGLNWTDVVLDWNTAITTLSVWTEFADVDLSATGLTGGQFYLMFSQTDNFPYGNLDGIGIDDIEVGEPGPTLAVSGLVAGGTATISTSNMTPGGLVGIAYSLTGAGPTNAGAGPCGTVTVDLSVPITTLPLLTADGAGNASTNAGVPANASGVSVWLHALDVGTCTLTNSLAEVIG